jgi:hypothetical protein
MPICEDAALLLTAAVGHVQSRGFALGCFFFSSFAALLRCEKSVLCFRVTLSLSNARRRSPAGAEQPDRA